ncbi:acyloxyacyl hydrolase [Tieghemostelium lacteum]|uniref:Acyloxyacyl hydrolase n=1 Tax=Tieghemostelium lacteum TaxID=361077 RepID=A0A152A292_TIELA|nr:acyloxyacyl hydrolase [Tieghemostelium lacteum]|eukprot:KYR00215.1 acyloxyacyl hydrolase [Tieghemostelium lacteum]
MYKIELFVVLVLLLSSSVFGMKPFNDGNTFHFSPNQPNEQYFKLTGVNSANGGSKCAGCTIALTLVEQYSLIHEKSIEDTLDEICSFFPGQVNSICLYLVNTFGEDIINLFDKYEHADDVCHALPNMCTSPECRLFPENTPTYYNDEQYHEEYNEATFTEQSPWSWIQNLINTFANVHEPIEDFDKDLYSLDSTFRGYNWRGRDCDDFSDSTYPGTYDDPSDPYVDKNCNGIFGVNNISVSWESVLCDGSGSMGVVVSGDSAGAHFSIPPQWMTAALINKTTYEGMIDILETEVDWPQRSTYTGWEPSTDMYTVQSMYLQLRERNLCNHRDYQNLGVNGANSGSTINIIKSFARNQKTDKPALFFLELVGNDVCSGHHTLDHMTTVEEFTDNIVTILNYLDGVLPNGSHVVFVGLADGRVLWDTLWNRTHPVGAKYYEVYNFLNCLQVSPCWGWMNPNETVRNATSYRAAQLSASYNQIIQSYKFANFDMQYYDFPFGAINEIWVAEGGQTWDLIEPVDGFHPNQNANYLMAEYFFNSLMQDHPDWLGAINPFNSLIQEQFGDQGGY